MSLAPSSSNGEAWKELPLQGVALREDRHMPGPPARREELVEPRGWRAGWWAALHQGRPGVLPHALLKNKTRKPHAVLGL